MLKLCLLFEANSDEIDYRIKAQVIDKDIHVQGDYRGDYKVITEQWIGK